MRLSEGISAVRRIVYDPVDSAVENPDPKFTDSEIAAHLTEQARSLARIQIQRDQGYHNALYALTSEQGIQVVSGVFQYPLPQWVSNIVRVCFRYQGDADVEDTWSPYTWTTPPALGEEIDRKGAHPTKWWWWDGNRTLRVVGYSGAPSLLLEVAKTPPPQFRAVLDIDPEDETRLWLPLALQAGTEDLAEGAYVNSEIQVVSSGADRFANLGQVRRVVWSASNLELDGVRRHELRLEAGLPEAMEQGDTVETLLPFPDEHCRALFLKVAWALFTKNGNLTGQKAIQAELSEELRMFSDYVTPRTTQSPAFYRNDSTIGNYPVADPDRASQWR